MLKKRDGKYFLVDKIIDRKVSTKKAQGSVEFIILLAVVLIIFLIIISLNTDYIDKISGDYNTHLIKNALNDMMLSATDVYKQGSGAKTTITITLPKNLVSSEVYDREIQYIANIKGSLNEYFRSTDFQVIGSLPTSEGIHKITIEAREGYVIINEKLLDVDPIYLSTLAILSNKTKSTVSFKNRYNASLNISITFSGDTELTSNLIYSKNFMLNTMEDFTFEANITMPAFVTKNRYYGVFKVNITNLITGDKDLLFIDYVVDIAQATIEIQNNAAFIYPTRWDTYLVPNQTTLQNFLICSGYPTFEQYVVSFSSDQVGNWMSFSAPGINRTSEITLNISSNECEGFKIYERGGTPFEGNYVGAIQSISPDSTLMSSLVYTTIYADNTPPNITGYNVSTTFGIIDDTVCVYVNVSDDTEIDDVWVSYTNPLNQSYYLYLSLNSSCPNASGRYSSSFDLDVPGYYYLNVTYATDISQNLANETINKIIFSKRVIFREPPIFAIEEVGRVGRQSWDATPFSIQNDGVWATTSDGSNPPVPPDYIDFTWGNFNIDDNETISQLKFTYVHRDRFNDDGVIDYNSPSEDYRHKIECKYNGSWLFLETYGLNRDQTVWNKYEILDISQCIDKPSDLNNFMMRVTFDPADNVGGSFSDIDFVELKAITTVSEQPILLEISADYPQPVDFTHGVNATRNSFGLLSKHGFDYNDSIYGDSGATPVNFAKYYAPSLFTGCVAPKCNITTQKRLEIKIGPGSTTEIMSSGAWGTSFNITNAMYDLIDKGARMYYSFTYYVEDLDKDLEEACWVKTRFNGTYLGNDLDGHPGFYLHYSDSTPDVWVMTDLNHPDGWNEVIMRSFGTDVTDFVTGPGWYTLDFGGVIDLRMADHTTTEGCGFYFDNIRLMIIDE
ncbi:MAG: hypothetical protein WC755_02610 [Candidatus Woesearchaeota archaeon]|jgi:hypothetical protein